MCKVVPLSFELHGNLKVFEFENELSYTGITLVGGTNHQTKSIK